MVGTFKQIPGIFILWVVLASCNNNVCNEQVTSYLNIHFYNKLTKSDSALGSITIYGINSLKKNDSIYKNGASVSTISLPLSTLHDTSAFYIAIDTTIIDTLTAIYKRKNIFVSYECGFRTEDSLTSITLSPGFIADSAVISQPHVSINNEINFKVYFYPVIHQ